MITSLFDFPTDDPTYTSIGVPQFGYRRDVRYLGVLGEGPLPLDRLHSSGRTAAQERFPRARAGPASKRSMDSERERSLSTTPPFMPNRLTFDKTQLVVLLADVFTLFNLRTATD